MTFKTIEYNQVSLAKWHSVYAIEYLHINLRRNNSCQSVSLEETQWIEVYESVVYECTREWQIQIMNETFAYACQACGVNRMEMPKCWMRSWFSMTQTDFHRTWKWARISNFKLLIYSHYQLNLRTRKCLRRLNMFFSWINSV